MASRIRVNRPATATVRVAALSTGCHSPYGGRAACEPRAKSRTCVPRRPNGRRLAAAAAISGLLAASVVSASGPPPSKIRVNPRLVAAVVAAPSFAEPVEACLRRGGSGAWDLATRLVDPDTGTDFRDPLVAALATEELLSCREDARSALLHIAPTPKFLELAERAGTRNWDRICIPVARREWRGATGLRQWRTAGNLGPRRTVAVTFRYMLQPLFGSFRPVAPFSGTAVLAEDPTGGGWNPVDVNLSDGGLLSLARSLPRPARLPCQRKRAQTPTKRNPTPTPSDPMVRLVARFVAPAPFPVRRRTFPASREAAWRAAVRAVRGAHRWLDTDLEVHRSSEAEGWIVTRVAVLRGWAVDLKEQAFVLIAREGDNAATVAALVAGYSRETSAGHEAWKAWERRRSAEAAEALLDEVARQLEIAELVEWEPTAEARDLAGYWRGRMVELQPLLVLDAVLELPEPRDPSSARFPASAELSLGAPPCRFDLAPAANSGTMQLYRGERRRQHSRVCRRLPRRIELEVYPIRDGRVGVQVRRPGSSIVLLSGRFARARGR